MPNWQKSLTPLAAFLASAISLLSVAAPANAAADRHEFAYAWDVAQIDWGPSANTSSVEAGDFDGDGRLDLVTIETSWTGASLVFLFQRADGLVPPAEKFLLDELASGQQVVGLAASDLDADGTAEVLVSTTQGLLVVRVGAGRSFASASFQSDGRVATSPPLSLDVDGDGHADVVQAERSDQGGMPGEIVIRYGDGTGALPRTRLVPTAGIRYGRFEAGDLNGDGVVDLAARLTTDSGLAAHPVAILLGDGRGSFLGPDTSVSGRSFVDVFVADVNGDGRDDVVMVNPSLGAFFNSDQLTQAHVHLQGMDGRLSTTATELALPGRAQTFDLRDLDGDGRRDLVHVTLRGEPRLAVRDGIDAGFQPTREFAVPNTGDRFGGSAWFARDSVAYGDFNGDGLVDAAVAGSQRRIVLMAGRSQPWATDANPPGAPRQLSAVLESPGLDTTVRLAFQPPLDDGGSAITRYEVVSEPEGGVLLPSVDVDPLALTRRVFGQVNDQRYRYRVRAYNAAGPGPLSEASPEVHVRMLPRLQLTSVDLVEPTSGAATLPVTIGLEFPALEGGVTFDLSTRGLTAQSGLDFEPLVLTGVHIPQGSKSVAVDVTLLGDDLVEGNEYFELLVGNIVGALATVPRVGATIQDSDGPSPLPLLKAHDASVIEGNSGTTVLRLPFTLSFAAATDVEFDVQTIDAGLATSGVDYLAADARLVIPAGQTSTYLDVQVIPDLEPELNESFEIQLSGLVGAYPAPVLASGTILNDDVALESVPEPILVDSEKGYVDRDLQDVYTETALLSGTELVVPALRRVVLGADPTPALPFDALSGGVTWTSVPVPANTSEAVLEVRVLAIAQSATAAEVALYVGEGTSPSPGSAACTRHDAGPAQVCELVLRREPGAPASTYWALAQNALAGQTGSDTVELELAAVTMVPANVELFASSQARIFGFAPARLGWDIPSLLPGERRVGYLMVESAPGGTIHQKPVRLQRTGAIDAPHVLAPGVARAVRLAPGDAQERLVFDVPANAQSVTFTLQGQGEVSLYAAHSAQPSSPGIAPAPARALADAVSSLPGAGQTITLSGAQLKKGRWYLTPVNRGSAPAAVTLRADVVSGGARPAFRPGHYYNAARPGHGFFLDFAGGQWLMVWYTYLQDGTPTWYYSQGLTPTDDQAQWSVDLLRVSRGETTRAVRVGSATITVLEGPSDASPKLAFGYNLDGDAGWETMTRLGDDSCPMVDGQELDGSGHWFSPSEPGHGFSAQILPYTEIYAAYVYDRDGFPRWLIGQKDFAPSVTAVTMQQLTGFCPTCPAVPLQSKSVGTVQRTLGLSSGNDGLPGVTSLALEALYEPRTWGEFYANAPVIMLSRRKGCD